ncbi:unnamed protein product [Didymodactylos carnosus]|nr:unnamed protein product [Didymodactylos carnosus]CAF4000208.1 unnamed protein product [Didymodactylos carnosus]
MTNSTSQMSTHVKGSSMHKNRTTISKPDFTLNDDNIGDDESDIDDEMDIDMAYQSDKDDGAQQLIELTFICLTKPSRMDRSRLEHIVEMGNCTLKNIYFLTPSKSITINEQMLTQTTEQIKKDLVNVFISVLKCGHFETQLAISPALKPVVLRGNNEIIYPSKTITINGFIELSSLRSPMAISKHILLPIQRQTRLQRSSSSTNYSIGANNTSGANSSTNSIITKKQLATKKPLPPMNSPMNSTNGNNNMNNFYYLLMISLKKEKSAALISINDEWYGAVYCQKFERKKRSSRLILSVFEPGDRIPWIPSFERLGPYAVVFPSATGTTDQQSSYRKQAWPVKHFVRSYTDSFLIWCRQNNFTSDINKFVRASAKLPEKSAFFYRELNKICRGAFVYALRGNLLQLLIQMFQRQIQLGKIKPDGVKHIQHVIQYMQRLKSQERFTDIPQLTSSASSGASVADNMTEEYFPRGSSGGALNKERTDIKDKTNLTKKTTRVRLASKFESNDDLFVLPKSKRKKQNQNNKNFQKRVETTKSRVDEDRQEKLYRRLNKQNLTDGVLVLGCIEKITPYEIRVSLPHQNIGYVPLSMISDEYTKILSSTQEENDDAISRLEDLFFVGQYVICRVIDSPVENEQPTKKQQRLYLTINPKDICEQISADSLVKGMLIPGVVSSIEDHGYLIDIGLQQRKGFVTKENMEIFMKNSSSDKIPDKLKIGYYSFFQLKETLSKGDNSRIVPLKFVNGVKRPALKSNQMPFHMLIPGMKCNVTVSKSRINGILVNFGEIKGFIHIQDLETLTINPDYYTADSEIEAIVLAIDSVTKLVYFTLQPHIFSLDCPLSNDNQLTVGTIKTCTIVKTIGSSLVIRLYGKQFGLVATSHLTDDKDADVEQAHGLFKPGQKAQCRIIGLSLSNNIIICSLKKYVENMITINHIRIFFFSFLRSIIDAPFITYSDINAGDIVKGTISHIDPKGLIISLAKHINGFVPIIHNADIPIKETMNKFAIKKKVQCRVIEVDPLRQRLILTLKKSLIHTKLPLVKSYNDLTKDLVTIGVIISINDYGLLVKLFGNVCGLVPKNEVGQLILSHTTTTKHQLLQMFYVGQTVSCRVLNFEVAQKRLTLSLKVPGKVAFGTKLAAVEEDFSIGKITKWKANNSGTEGHISGIVLTNEKIPLFVYLSKTHLTDFVEHQTFLLNYGYNNSELEREGIYWSRTSFVNISMRRILIDYCKHNILPQTLEECTTGLMIPGVVQNIFEYGLFIDLPNDIVAFAPNKYLDLNTLQTIEKKYHIAQTVIVRVVQIDNEKQRCIVNLKPLLYESETDNQFRPESILSHYLDEKFEIINLLKKNGTGLLHKFLNETKWLGHYCRCAIEKRDGDWFLCRIDNGLISRCLYDAHYSVGDTISGHIIDIDLSNQQFIITTDLLMNKNQSNIDFNTIDHLSFESCTVLCQLSSYAIGIIGTSVLVHIPTFSHLNSFYCSNLTYQRKQVLKLENVEYTRSPLHHYIISHSTQSLVSKKILYEPDEIVNVTICDVLPKQLNVRLEDGSRGRIHITEICDKPSETFPSLTDQYQTNQQLKVRIISTRNIEQTKYHLKPVYELTLRSSTQTTIINDQLYGFIDKIDQNHGLWFFLSLHVRALVPNLLISTNPNIIENLAEHFRIGQCCQLNIVSKRDEHRYDASLIELKPPKIGTVVCAQFKQILSPNEFVFSLPTAIDGTLLSTDVTDNYVDYSFWTKLMNIKKPTKTMSTIYNMKREHRKFKNKIVQVYIKNINDENKISLSTRKSRIFNNHLDVTDEEVERLEQLAVGDVIRGYISSLTNRQLTLLIGQSITGRIEKIPMRPLHGHLREYLDVGMVVEGEVLKIDIETNSCSMKLTNEFIQQFRKEKGITKTKEHEEDEPNAKRMKVMTDNSVDSLVDLGGLGGNAKFEWHATLNDLSAHVENGNMDEKEDEEVTTITNGKRKKIPVIVENGTKRQKRTNDEFEQLVTKAPNDSHLWIDYMQYYLTQAEIDHARSVAEKALRTIFYREERDKLNIWVAYLDLESKHGTPEKLNQILSRAVGNCDALSVYQRLAADVYEKNNQLENANATYSLMVKKFAKEKVAWLSYIIYLFKQHHFEQAKSMLDKSFLSLPATDHVEMINKYAQLEFKYGDKERGKTMYEKLLANSPKRTDLWSLYIDMVIKYDQDISTARTIFDRLLSLNISPKKMKFIVKKYLGFERQYGTPKDIDHAKQRVLEYVNSNDINTDERTASTTLRTSDYDIEE